METTQLPPDNTRKVLTEDDAPDVAGDLLTEEMIRRVPQNYYVFEMRTLDPPEPIRHPTPKDRIDA